MTQHEKVFRERVSKIINNIFFQANTVEEYLLRKASEEVGHTKLKNFKMAIQELLLIPHDEGVQKEKLKGTPDENGRTQFSQTAIPALEGQELILPVNETEKVVYVEKDKAERVLNKSAKAKDEKPEDSKTEE